METTHNAMANWVKRYGTLLGRIFIAMIFLGAAWSKITGFSGTTGYMKSVMGSLSDGLISFLLIGAILFLVVGGFSVLLGWQARLGALLLFVFLLIVTPVFHAFWAAGQEQFMMQMMNFQKNLAIMGGLLVVMAFGAGPLSIDAWLGSRTEQYGQETGEPAYATAESG